MSFMDEEERNGRELPEEPFSAVISTLNKKLINIIKNEQLTDQEIHLFLSELETAREQMERIINELTHTFEHQNGYAEISEWEFRKTHALYTEQLHFYIPYYIKIINNLKDVVIFTNQNSCLFQVYVKDIHFLFTIKDFRYEYIRLVDRMAARGEEIIPDEFAVMDVYDTDDEYYYGICNGKKVFTPIENTDKLSPDSVAHFPLNYLVINDHFMNLLFTTDLSTDNPNIPHKLLLFECGSAEFVKKCIFYDDSYVSDDSDDDRPPLRRMPRWIPQDAQKQTFHPFTLFDLFLTKSKNYAEIFRDRYQFPLNTNDIWNIFFNLLTSNNKLHRTCALQNFKHFFIKNDVELNKLHEDINRYTRTNTQFTNMKLIDFFMSEIKFLLRKILYNKLKIRDSLQWEWDAYVLEYNKSADTPPQFFLHYLLNVVLFKLVSKDLFISLITTLGSMSKSLSAEMSKEGFDRPEMHKFITDIIDSVLRQFKLKQQGGKLVSKKKNRQKLLNNKINSRQKKISRKK